MSAARAHVTLCVMGAANYKCAIAPRLEQFPSEVADAASSVGRVAGDRVELAAV